METFNNYQGSVPCPCVESEMEIIASTVDDLLYKTQVQNLWPIFPKGWGLWDGERTEMHSCILRAEANRLLNRARVMIQLGKTPTTILEIAAKFLISIHEQYEFAEFEDMYKEIEMFKVGKKKSKTKEDDEKWNKDKFSSKAEREGAKIKGEELTKPDASGFKDENWNSNDYVSEEDKKKFKKDSEGLGL